MVPCGLPFLSLAPRALGDRFRRRLLLAEHRLFNLSTSSLSRGWTARDDNGGWMARWVSCRGRRLFNEWAGPSLSIRHTRVSRHF
ncbi:hypothetical protein CGRA01v4_01648 [Colletotrichum graminicola]|nr:hypothetical protein CGRA01v4_01648 [Colletotrichum graminicola]